MGVRSGTSTSWDQVASTASPSSYCSRSSAVLLFFKGKNEKSGFVHGRRVGVHLQGLSGATPGWPASSQKDHFFAEPFRRFSLTSSSNSSSSLSRSARIRY